MLFTPIILFGLTAAALPTFNTTLVDRRSDDNPYGESMARCDGGYHSEFAARFSKTSDLKGKGVYACCEERWTLSNKLTKDNKLQCEFTEPLSTYTSKKIVGRIARCDGSEPCPNHPGGCCVKW